jgi:hypothetical protein
MVKAAGTVYRGETQERAIAAVLKAKPAAGALQFVVTDDDGDFEFPDLTAGKWTLQALDEVSSPSVPLDLDLQEDQTALKLSLRRTMGVDDKRFGVWFFAGLIAALVILIAGYIYLHHRYSPSPEPPPAEPAVFWTDPPGRYFEVMLWGLAGVLVSLILTVATYLRWGRFYREGWVLHVAQLVVVPLLTLVVVALLSLTEFSLTVGSSELKIDLDDPLLLAMVSFLVAFGPWDAVRSLRAASSRLMSSTQAPAP